MADVATAPVALGGGEFRIGAAIGRSGSIVWRHLARYLPIAAVAHFPYFVSDLVDGPGPATIGQMGGANGPGRLWFLLGWILTVFAQASIYHDGFGILAGHRPPIGQSLRTGMVRFWPLLGAGIIQWVAMVFGFALLIAPGLIVIVMWFVASPACVVERLGAIKCLDRSAALTKGHRWKIFGLIVLLLVAFVIVAGVALMVASRIGGVAHVTGEYVFQAIFIIGTAVVPVVVYHDLRVAKEGVEAETVAAVFE